MKSGRGGPGRISTAPGSVRWPGLELGVKPVAVWIFFLQAAHVVTIGREAVRVQKALLVLTLVGASFAGGAVVNGPGLAWVRDMVGLTPPKLNPLPAEPASELPSFDLGKPASGGAESASASKPIQPLVAGLDHAGQAPLPVAGTVQHPAKPKSAPVDPWGVQPPSLEPPSTTSRGSAATAISEPPAPTTDLTRDELLRRSSAAVGTGASGRPDPGLPPTPMPVSGPAVAVAAAATGASASTWADLARKLKAQGVSRFWIEGEPGQTVRFRCAVPVPGHASVSQQFEAESQDVLSAAESVLRRIVAWRVSENP